MKVRSTRLMAVLTVAILTLASGTIQACALLCQPVEIVAQDDCSPSQVQHIRSEDCTMDDCGCTLDSQPTQQEDSHAFIAAKAPTWDVPATATSENLPSFEVRLIGHDDVVTYRDRGPPKQTDLSANGLRAPPSQRA